MLLYSYVENDSMHVLHSKTLCDNTHTVHVVAIYIVTNDVLLYINVIKEKMRIMDTLHG